MIRKIIPVFTAAAISMSITFVVPVAITAVSSFTFVSEAQALGIKSFKKSIKKARTKQLGGHSLSFVWESVNYTINNYEEQLRLNPAVAREASKLAPR
jgi:hypothetical protein